MEASTGTVIFLFTLAVAAYIIWFKSITHPSSGPRVWPILGILPGIIRHTNRLHDWVAEDLRACGGTYRTCIHAVPFLATKQAHLTLTCDPKNIEHILKLRFDNYLKGPTWQAVFHDLLGDSIINTDGDTWLSLRKTMALEFTNKKLRQTMSRWVNPAIKNKLWPILATAQQEPKPVDIQDIMLRFNFDNICGFAFGQDPKTLSPGLPDNRFAMAFDQATEATLQRMLFPEILWKLKKWLRLGMEPSMTRSLTYMEQHLSNIINERKLDLLNLQRIDDEDMLSRFMNKKEFCSGVFLRHLALSIILGGRDTSSVGLSWFFWLCMKNPRVEEKILVELCTVLMETRGGDVSAWLELEEPLTFDEIGRLVYLKAALMETLRLYPPVPQDIKHVLNDDVLPSGTFVPAGSKVIYSIYSIGRMEFIWGHDCLEFRPARWLSADGNKIEVQDPYKFASFNAGPRICLGKDLAYLQMMSIAAAVLLRHRLSLVPGHPVEQKISLTLVMKYGLRVTVQPRDLRSVLEHMRKDASSCGNE